MIAGILYTIVGFVEMLVGLRFIFRLLGANPANTIVNLIYDWSTPFVTPFSGILGQGAATTSVFDWTALIAVIVYGLLGAILIRTTARFAPR